MVTSAPAGMRVQRHQSQLVGRDELRLPIVRPALRSDERVSLERAVEVIESRDVRETVVVHPRREFVQSATPHASVAARGIARRHGAEGVFGLLTQQRRRLRERTRDARCVRLLADTGRRRPPRAG
jgi:hypothetical protein